MLIWEEGFGCNYLMRSNLNRANVMEELTKQEIGLRHLWHTFMVCVKDRRKFNNVYVFGDPGLEISSLLKGQVETKIKMVDPHVL